MNAAARPTASVPAPTAVQYLLLGLLLSLKANLPNNPGSLGIMVMAVYLQRHGYGNSC